MRWNGPIVNPEGASAQRLGAIGGRIPHRIPMPSLADLARAFCGGGSRRLLPSHSTVKHPRLFWPMARRAATRTAAGGHALSPNFDGDAVS